MRMLTAIVVGWLIAGTLDIIYAITAHGVRGVPPIRIWQSVASGVQGTDAYSGGMASAILGGGLHYFIMLIMAGVYVIAGQVFPILTSKPVVSGLAYGVVLMAVMNYVVVPLSAAVPGKVPEGWYFVGALFAHTCLVGLPIAWAAAKFSK
ncbi:hypothetical protein [Kordiimonas sp.]|uniref:hypothetical protein n=2 Tax=Kordiimonas sp. TaxID=1970157 RepID=UPI003A916E68